MHDTYASNASPLADMAPAALLLVPTVMDGDQNVRTARDFVIITASPSTVAIGNTASVTERYMLLSKSQQPPTYGRHLILDTVDTFHAESYYS